MQGGVRLHRIHAGFEPLPCGQDGGSFLEQPPPAGGQADALGKPVEQGGPCPVFHVADGMGDGGLGEVEVFRRLGEAACPGDRAQDLHMPQDQEIPSRHEKNSCEH